MSFGPNPSSPDIRFLVRDFGPTKAMSRNGSEENGGEKTRLHTRPITPGNPYMLFSGVLGHVQWDLLALGQRLFTDISLPNMDLWRQILSSRPCRICWRFGIV
jgi:hypothetical protein